MKATPIEFLCKDSREIPFIIEYCHQEGSVIKFVSAHADMLNGELVITVSLSFETSRIVTETLYLGQFIGQQIRKHFII